MMTYYEKYCHLLLPSFYLTNFFFFLAESHWFIPATLSLGDLPSWLLSGDFCWTCFSHSLAVLGVPTTAGLTGVGLGVEISAEKDSWGILWHCCKESSHHWLKHTDYQSSITNICVMQRLLSFHYLCHCFLNSGRQVGEPGWCNTIKQILLHSSTSLHKQMLMICDILNSYICKAYPQKILKSRGSETVALSVFSFEYFFRKIHQVQMVIKKLFTSKLEIFSFFFNI